MRVYQDCRIYVAIILLRTRDRNLRDDGRETVDWSFCMRSVKTPAQEYRGQYCVVSSMNLLRCIVASARLLSCCWLFCLGGCVAASTAILDTGSSARLANVWSEPRGLRNVGLELEIEISNAASQPYRVSEVLYEVDTGTVAGRFEGQERIETVFVQPQQQVAFVFDMEISLRHDSQSYSNIVSSASYPASIAGSVVLDDGSVHPFAAAQAELQMPKLPRFSIHDASLTILDGRNLEFNFVFRLENPNEFAVLVRSVDFGIIAQGQDIVVEQEAGIGTRLAAAASEDYKVRIVLDDLKHPAITQVLAEGEVDCQIVGELLFSNLVIPINLARKLKAQSPAIPKALTE